MSRPGVTQERRVAARLVPLRPELLALIPASPDQPLWSATLTAEIRGTLCQPDLAFALLEGGYCIGAGGVLPMWPGRAIAWLVAGGDTTRWHLLHAVRLIRPWFDRLQRDPRFRRLECSVVEGFHRGARFAELLGFHREGFMRHYGPDGAHHHLFARFGAP